jgi:hypothetical protein
VRPATGVTRIARKYSGDTISPSTCSASPWPLIDSRGAVTEAIASNDDTVL